GPLRPGGLVPAPRRPADHRVPCRCRRPGTGPTPPRCRCPSAGHPRPRTVATPRPAGRPRAYRTLRPDCRRPGRRACRPACTCTGPCDGHSYQRGTGAGRLLRRGRYRPRASHRRPRAARTSGPGARGGTAWGHPAPGRTGGRPPRRSGDDRRRRGRLGL
ncbi:uncharacterized protein METZ01_LOCUS267222, partial [marine metagenome]